MFVATALKTLIPEPWRRSMRDAHIKASLNHLHGPKTLSPSLTDPVVTCLVKNGEFYIEQFIAHYFALGFRHICFLDNGSTDATIARATAHKDVTVYSCHLPVGGLQGLLKRHFVERVVPSGWCVDVDIDEFFEYPYSDRLALKQLFEYLNGKGYTAVMTQMLDMFSDRPLAALMERQEEDLKDVHRYYDVSQVTKTRYRADALTAAHGNRNEVSGEEFALYWGGVRETLCGTHCLLTKHSAFRTGVGLELFPHVHYVNGARLADVSAVLLHYKFASNAYDEAAQNRAAFSTNSRGYDKMMETITTRPHLRLKTETAQEFTGATGLADNGYLIASEAFRAHVATASRHAPADAR